MQGDNGAAREWFRRTAKTADLSARRFVSMDCRVKPGNDSQY
ncbi:MAG: hypothetical protein OJF48_000096 [Afipia sp.]|nr:MAG: hypothetical protein OJF48_000096 [Afipia sp.]